MNTTRVKQTGSHGASITPGSPWTPLTPRCGGLTTCRDGAWLFSWIGLLSRLDGGGLTTCRNGAGLFSWIGLSIRRERIGVRSRRDHMGLLARRDRIGLLSCIYDGRLPTCIDGIFSWNSMADGFRKQLAA